MAPEQLKRGQADPRSDIWAFGCVVYEMVTGKKAFEGKSQASLIHSIMGVDPRPISSLQPLSSPMLDQLIRICLAKDPDAVFYAQNYARERSFNYEFKGHAPVGLAVRGESPSL